MAKKIKNMNKAELIAYATSIGIEDVDRYLTVKQILALIANPPKIEKGEPAKPAPLGPLIVFCKACGRHVSKKEAKLCPDCKIWHCAMDSVPGTCIKCGLHLDPVLRKLKKEQKAKDDNKDKK